MGVLFSQIASSTDIIKGDASYIVEEQPHSRPDSRKDPDWLKCADKLTPYTHLLHKLFMSRPSKIEHDFLINLG
jgi:hypothetical protein